MQLQVEYVDISTIKPYKGNAKEHPKEQIEQIKKSMQEFGVKDPIGIWHNEIVEGHGRYLALKELGETQVPVIRLDDLTDEQRKAYTLIHNQLTMNTGFDVEALEAELASISDIDMSEYGFDIEKELGGGTGQVEEDDFDEEPPEEPISKLGDIYQLGEHRLMCGDSTNPEHVAKLMDGAKADMVFTDPPYGMRLDTDYSSMVNRLDFAKEKNVKSGKKYDAVIGDNQDFKPELIETVTNNFNYCKEMFLWGADYYAELLKEKNKGSWFVWDKRLDDNADKMYGSCFELCWSKNKHKRDIARIKWAGIFGTEQEFDHKRHHPTQKPINLAMWFLERYSKTDNVIVDLYGGSGSTLIACEQLKRKCYMMELDPKYVDVIIKRWEEYTGKKAEKIC